MTVTGHVPKALNAFEGVEAGMDQINHLNYVTTMMRAPGAERAPVDVNSETAQTAIRFFKEHRTVIDPTAGWGEMASHSNEVDVASFEPGILKSPFVLDAKFRGMSGNTTAVEMRERVNQSTRGDRRAASCRRDHRAWQRYGTGGLRFASRNRAVRRSRA